MNTNFFSLAAMIFTLAVALGYLNYRFVRMQSTIAIMFGALLLSLCLLILDRLGVTQYEHNIALALAKLNFHDLLMNGMLSFLLFAGALTINLNELLERRWEVGVLATLGTIVSAGLVGVLTYYLLPLFGFGQPLLYCLLFGALISPTDPIAVIATVKEIGAPRSLSTMIAGESLFNDGIAIVLFLTLYHVAFSGQTATVQSVGLLFLREAIGGMAYGIVLGLVAYALIKPINNHKLEILLTLCITTGGYALAQMLEISGPLAMVVAGIFIGNHGRLFFMSRKTCRELEHFWELVDEILNAILFLLIGLEILVLHLSYKMLLTGLVAIPMVLFVRFLIVAVPMNFFKRFRAYSPYVISILTWGGLRGGLAVAMALSLPGSEYRDLVLTMTYMVVVFSILIQGTTIKSLAKLSLYAKP